MKSNIEHLKKPITQLELNLDVIKKSIKNHPDINSFFSNISDQVEKELKAEFDRADAKAKRLVSRPYTAKINKVDLKKPKQAKPLQQQQNKPLKQQSVKRAEPKKQQQQPRQYNRQQQQPQQYNQQQKLQYCGREEERQVKYQQQDYQQKRLYS